MQIRGIIAYAKRTLGLIAILAVGFYMLRSDRSQDGAIAETSQDNNSGINTFVATDVVGMFNIANSVVEGGYVTLESGVSIAQFSVSETIPTNSSGRKTLYISGININSSTVPYIDVYNCDGTSSDDVIWSGIGINSGNGVWADISSIPSSYSCTKVHIPMVKDHNGNIPGIAQVDAHWIPSPVVDMDIVGPSSGTAGQCFTYTFRWALSYVDKNGFVMYVTLPSLANGGVTSFNPAYSQFPSYNPLFQDASDGGQYTVGGTSINGTTIPANSIYRNPDNAKEGNTYNYKFTMCSPKGTQTGVVYTLKGSQATPSSILNTNTLSTKINSNPIGELNNVGQGAATLRQFMQGGYDAGSEIQLGAASNPKTITYYYDVANGRANNTATEDIFNPVISIDFSGAFTELQTACGDADDNASKARVILPEGFSRVGTSAIKTITGSMLVSNHDTSKWTVNYDNCNTSNTKIDIVIKFAGDNIPQLYYNYPLNIVNGATPNPGGPVGGRTMSIGATFEGFSNLYGGEGEIWVRNPIGVEGGFNSTYHIGSDYYGVYTVGVTYSETNNSLGNSMLVTRIPDDLEIVDVIQGQYWMSPGRNVQASGFTIRQAPFGPRWAGFNNDAGYYILDKGILGGSWNPSIGYGPDATGSLGNFRYNGLYPIHDDYKFFFSSDPGSITSTYPSYTIPSAALTGGLPSSIGSNWTSSPSSGSRWVGMYIKCIEGTNPAYQDSSSTICQYSSPVVMKIIVKPKTKYTCGASSPVLTSNSRLFYDYRTNNTQNRDQDFVYQPGEIAGVSNGGGTNGGNGLQMQSSWDGDLLMQNQTTVKVQIVDNGGSFAPKSAFISGQDNLNAVQTGNYFFQINNGSGSSMSDINLTIDIPSVNINGNPTYPNVTIDPAGGTIVSQNPNKIILNLGNLPVNQSIQAILGVSYPAGFADNSPVILTGTYTYSGECNTLSGEFSKLVTLKSTFTSPNLSGTKYLSDKVIPLTGTITYAIDVANMGTKVANSTWIVDSIPHDTSFVEAYTAGGIQSFPSFSGLGANYDCVGCQVYFSKGLSIASGSVSKDVANAISQSGSSYHTFVLGNNAGGLWTPNGMTLSEVRWIAFDVKDVQISERNIVGFKVQNEYNTFQNTIVNVASVVANELKAATTNQVQTNLIYDPEYNIFDISLEKYVHTTGQNFTGSISGVKPGDKLYFELILKNLSGSIASSVSVDDILPTGFIQSGNISSVVIQAAGVSGEAGIGVYDSGTRLIHRSNIYLNTGDMAVLTIPVIAESVSSCTTINNTGNIVGYSGQDTNLNNHTASASVNICPSAFDVDITKTVDHHYTYSGDILTYKLTRSKTGDAIVNNYAIEDLLPSNVSYISSSNGGVYNNIANKVTRTLAPLVGNTGGVLYITGVVNSNIATGYIFTNNVSICESGNILCCSANENNCTNNTGTAHNELYDLSIIKTNDGYNTSSGSIINYTLKYILSGNARNDIKVVDILPDNVAFVSGSNSPTYDAINHTVSWSGLSLPTNGSGFLYISARTLNNNSYNFTNTGKVGTNTGVSCIDDTCNLCAGETNCTNNSGHVDNGLFDLSVIKTNDKYYTKSGDMINYRLQYILSGNARSDIKVVDILPDNVAFVSGSNSPTYDAVNHTVSWSGLSLPTNGSGFLYISARTLNNNSYNFTNTGKVGTNTGVSCIDDTCNLCVGEFNCTNNEDDISNEIYDLTIEKTVNKYYTSQGDVISYTLKYTLKGLARADIKVTDYLPNSLQFISGTNNPIYDAITKTLTWTNLALGTDGSGLLYITAQVNTGFTGYDIYNTGDVVACPGGNCDINPEYNTGNNTGTAHNELYDLSIIKTNDGYNTSSGSIINYTLKYILSGNTRNDIKVVDILPDNVAFVSGSNSPTYDAVNHTVSWSGLSLPTNGSGFLYISARTLNNNSYNFTNTGKVGTNTGVSCIDDTCNLCVGETNCTNNSGHVDNGLFDLSVIKTNDKYYTKSGDIINYRLQYILSGNARNDIKVVDILPDNVAFVSGSNSPTYDAANHTVSWSNLSLATNGSGFLYISARTLNNDSYNFTNTGKVGTNTGVSCIDDTCNLCVGEFDCTNNEDDINNEIYDLTITKSTDRYYTVKGGIITYTLEYALKGLARTDIKITDYLPSSLQFLSGSNSPVYDAIANTLTWTNIALGTDGTGVLYLTAQVNTGFTGYDIYNTGDIVACPGGNCDINPEYNTGNNTGTARNELYDLSIIKTNDKHYTKSGDIINYRLQYILSGNARNDIKVVDILPDNVAFVSGSNSPTYDAVNHTVSWSNLSLAKDSSNYLYISARVLNNDIYNFTNTGKVGTNTGALCIDDNCDLCGLESDCTNNSGHVDNEIYDLTIDKSVNITNNAFFEEELIYTLNYALSGNARTDVSIVDKLPDEVDFVSTTMSDYQLYIYNSGQYLSWTGISMPKDGTGTLKIVVKIKPYSRFTDKGLSADQATRTVVTNNVVIGINTGTTISGFTYEPEYNTGNNRDNVNTRLRCNKDGTNCNGNTPPPPPSPKLVCRNGQNIEIYDYQMMTGDTAGTCVIAINVCRDNKIVSIKPSDLKSTDVQGNSCPKIIVCRDNKMTAILSGEKLDTDLYYCVPPMEPPMIAPLTLPKTGIELSVGIEARR